MLPGAGVSVRGRRHEVTRQIRLRQLFSTGGAGLRAQKCYAEGCCQVSMLMWRLLTVFLERSLTCRRTKPEQPRGRTWPGGTPSAGCSRSSALRAKPPEKSDFSSPAPGAGCWLQRQRVTLGGRVLSLPWRLLVQTRRVPLAGVPR